MQEDGVESKQSSAEASRDWNRDQSGSVEMQLEGQTVQASAQRVKRLAEAVLHRDSDTRARSSNEPMPDSGTDMNSIVTKEQCGQRIQSVLKQLGFIDRKNLAEDFTWHGFNQGYVTDVITMILSDDLVQSKSEMMLKDRHQRC